MGSSAASQPVSRMTQSTSARQLSVSGLVSHKTYTVSRSTVLAGLALLAVSTACSGAAGWYILSKDDLAARLIARETTRQYAYEDRIATLRADIDRLASRALLDQDGVEARVDELATRQADLESRQALVASLTETLQSGGLLPAAPRTAPLSRQIQPEPPVRASSFAPIAPGKPMPALDAPSLRGGDERRPAGWRSGESDPTPPAKRVAAALSVLDDAMAQTAQSQLDAVRQMDRRVADSQKTLRAALAETGLDMNRVTPADATAGGLGGPFVPFRIDPSAGPFEATLGALQPRIQAVLRLRAAVERLPLRRPMAGDVDMSSNFGYRVDPFTRGPAMHTGVDFRGDHGAPIRATAPGKVVTAEYSGGYGNMVEIEHAGGVTTRYAHMSAIMVSPGQTVSSGAVLGRVGSTGRSTGPHLHYETRIDDEPVDPIRFLRAGGKLAGKL